MADASSITDERGLYVPPPTKGVSMPDKFWESFGKLVAVMCFLFTMACAGMFVAVLLESYGTIIKQEPITVLPMDSSHVHKGK